MTTAPPACPFVLLLLNVLDVIANGVVCSISNAPPMPVVVSESESKTLSEIVIDPALPYRSIAPPPPLVAESWLKRLCSIVTWLPILIAPPKPWGESLLLIATPSSVRSDVVVAVLIAPPSFFPESLCASVNVSALIVTGPPPMRSKICWAPLPLIVVDEAPPPLIVTPPATGILSLMMM